MPLSEGLFRSQDQAEQDLQNAPGWTIDQQKPSFWEGFGGVVPALRGVASGLLETGGAAASSLPALARFPARGTINPVGIGLSEPAQKAWEQPIAEWSQGASAAARAGAKSVMPDPRTTGTAANLVNGFSRAVTEFTAGSLVGGPEAGAAVLGSTEAYARYHDLLDQGVDEATARKSAFLTGATAGAGALLPMALPARLLEPLSSTGALLAQTGAGATINTSFGAVARAGDAEILRQAGYPDMADQVKVWDRTNLATDFLTGSFFGAHAGLHEIRVDPAIRDAARVVQDRQEIINRAPGVPVDMKSAAVHREALESALGDLLLDKPVALDERVDGAAFARPDQDTALSRQIIHDEFEKSGVLGDAEEFDRWLRGEEPPKAAPEAPRETEAGELVTPESVTARLTDAQARLEAAGPEMKPEERAAAVAAERDRIQQPEAVRERLEQTYGEQLPRVLDERAEAPFKAADEARTTAQKDLEKAQADQEQLARTADPAAAALADRPNLELPEGVKAADALEEARTQSQEVDKEAETAFHTAVTCEARHA